MQIMKLPDFLPQSIEVHGDGAGNLWVMWNDADGSRYVGNLEAMCEKCQCPTPRPERDHRTIDLFSGNRIAVGGDT